MRNGYYAHTLVFLDLGVCTPLPADGEMPIISLLGFGKPAESL